MVEEAEPETNPVRFAMIMPTNRAGKLQHPKAHLIRRGIIPSSALWPLCRYRHNGHATGHPSRLNRDLRNSLGSPDYAREELRAEIAQVMVCTELGIGECEFTNGAAYIASWLETLRSDRKEIFRAAADAQRIADYLLALHPDYAARHLDTMISAEDAPAATREGQATSALAAK